MPTANSLERCLTRLPEPNCLEHGDWDVRIATGWIAIDSIAIARPTGAVDCQAREGMGFGLRRQRNQRLYRRRTCFAKDQQGCYTVEDVQRGQWTPAAERANHRPLRRF